MKHFYSHLIAIESIHIKLTEVDLSPEEKDELVFMVESSVHHVVLDTVLSELSEKDKKALLSHIAAEKHDDIWNLLKTNIENVEDKIKIAAETLLKELHKDIDETKKNNL